MIKQLTVINLKANSHANPMDGNVFVLKTCQRTLLLGFGEAPFLHLRDDALREEIITDIFEEKNAYIFLLETICGLRSEVVSENEVVCQFREAYQEFAQLKSKNTKILAVLEKLFQDNKKIRTDHLGDIGQLTYAGIARKLIHTSVKNGDVLVLGSGTLALDLIKLLIKKHNVFISARNDLRTEDLCQTYSLQSIPWGSVGTYAKFPSIVNTIGANEILFDEIFFSQFMQTSSLQMKLFIDLGSPSVIETNLSEKDGVVRLEDIFRQSAKLNIEKMEKIHKAKNAILEVAKRRESLILPSAQFDWKELTFAYSL